MEQIETQRALSAERHDEALALCSGAAESPLDFEPLLRRHQGMVYSIARNFLGDTGRAEEVAQEVFLQLHSELNRIESNEHAAAWLRRVTAHRSIDALRNPASSRSVDLESLKEPEQPAEQRDVFLTESLRRMVASLPEKQRITIILRYQEDLDPGEIARVLGMPLATVKSHLRRALDMLRQKSGRLRGASGAQRK